MIKLYDYPQCPFCRKVRVALAEKGIEYEKIFVDLRKKEQNKEDFLKLNPYGKVPVLVDDGVVIYESSVINEYLDEKYPDPSLMPSDPADRARARILVDFCESHFHPSWFNIYIEMTFKPEDKRNRELIEKSKNELKEHLRRLNQELEGREYLVGSYSLADIAFTPRVALFNTLGIQVSPELKNVIDWVERIKSRPSYKALEL
jgi:RNA polymerase-associated protein